MNALNFSTSPDSNQNDANDPADVSGCEHLAATLRAMGLTWRDAAQKALQGLGLTLLQWAALELVWAKPGMSQVELARAMGIEGPSLVRLLDDLEAASWLCRKGDTSDRRVKRVYPDERAHERMAQAEKTIDAVQKKAVSRLSAHEQKAFAHLLELAIEGLRAPDMK